MNILETKRLILRLHEDRDLDALTAIFEDINVMRYLGNGTVATRENALRSIANWQKYFKEKGYCNWAVEYKDTGGFIGQCGFNEIPDKTEIEISYMFAKEYWEKGIATEIASAVMDYGFGVLNLQRVIALAYPENAASIHVIEKLGMQYEREAEFWGKKLLMYSKNNPNINVQS